MNIVEKYRILPLEKLLDAVYKSGADYEHYSGSCSQCAVAALQKYLGFEDIVVKIATSSCGGQAGLTAGTCGGLIGGTIVLDYFFGRPASDISDKEMIQRGNGEVARAMEAARLLGDKYIREYGSILCPQIQERLFGRRFNFDNSEDWQAFDKAGAHADPTKCMSVVGKAARWTMEILIEKGAIEF